ncbi:MAG: hypothetical protein ACC667_10540 [Longimicrobiales bacterium]
MSNGTGFVIAAYATALATVFTYAAVLIAGNRAAARRLDEARARHQQSGGEAAENATAGSHEEAGHV